MPIFRLKRKVTFAVEANISKELDRLKQINVLAKTDFRDWASSIVYIKKKNNRITSRADFSTGLNCFFGNTQSSSAKFGRHICKIKQQQMVYTFRFL